MLILQIMRNKRLITYLILEGNIFSPIQENKTKPL